MYVYYRKKPKKTENLFELNNIFTSFSFEYY